MKDCLLNIIVQCKANQSDDCQVLEEIQKLAEIAIRDEKKEALRDRQEQYDFRCRVENWSSEKSSE